MFRLFNWIVGRPRLSAALALCLTAGLAAGLPRLTIDASTQSLFPLNEPDVEYFHNARANFGSDSLITVVAKADDIFQAEVLAEVRDLALDLDQIDGVRSALSVFSLRTPKRTGVMMRLEPLIDEIPEDPAALAKLRSETLANPFVRGRFLSEDGSATAIHVLLRAETGQTQYEKHLVTAVNDRVAAAIDASGSEVDYYSTGAPVIKSFAARYIWHDLVVLGPVTLLAIGGVIFLFFRSILATFLPLITGSLSVLATLGFMGFAGFTVNPFASVIVVLILVMGCTEDLHIISEYFLGLRRGLSKREAVRALGRTVANALLLTSVTTFIGFLSIAPNPISGLREFAIACAVGIALNFIITLLLVPSILQFARTPARTARAAHSRLDKLRRKLVSLTADQPAKVAAIALIFALAAVFGTTRLEIDTSYIRFFPKDSEVGQAYTNFSRDFGGASTFMVTVETGKERGVYEIETLRQIARLHDHLQEEFDHTFGIVDFIREINFLFSDPEPDIRMLPDTQKKVDMFSRSLGRRFESAFVDYDGSRTAIRVRSFIPGSKGMRRTEEEILRFARENLPPDLEVRVTGERVLTARFSDRVTRQLIQNLLILSAVVTLVLIFFFRSVRIGLLAIVPNMFPVLATFGYMGWAGIPLSTGTFAVAIVALGIAVDDTIHFMTRYFHETQEGDSIEDVLSRTLEKEIQPILSTSIALTLGYLVLLFSPFLIHRETGLLFAIAITTACFSDLFVTPVLLRFFGKPRQKIFETRGNCLPKNSTGN